MSTREFWRSFDVAELNRLLNHPSIRPHVGGSGMADGKAVLDAGAAFYLSDQGATLFHEGEPGFWEGHLLFTAPSPYKMALGMVHAFVLEFAPKMLWGKCAVANRAARLFARRIGFTSLGIRSAPLPSEIFVWKRALHGRNS